MNAPVEQRDAAGRFLPGFTANPSGKPRVVSEIRELAAKRAPAAFQRICELVGSDDERIAFAAAQEILNRAYGKPVQAVEQKIESISYAHLFLDALQRFNHQPTTIEIDANTSPLIEW